ncbi:putative T7SS-secreted protein [Streptomyces sp. NPDC003035]|uniref:putative T7SS-secreted protein n=1 Tax=Streptomyces sp. NPDC003035 TaxID=3364676 RepID=UPI0036CDA978
MGGLLDDIGNGLSDLGKGIEGGINEGLGAIEDGIDSGKKALGETVDWATDKAGDRLDSYGLHGAADVVTDWGDGVASDLGATPGEKQLGQTEEANELVRGNATKILESAAHLKDFRAAFEQVGQGMRKVDSSRWKGEAGNAFREKFGLHPTKWLHAADACEEAAAGLEAYAHTVKWAQNVASEAIDMYRRGKRAEGEVKAAVAASKDPDAAKSPEAVRAEEAAKALVEEAKALLAQAREQRNTAATDAQSRVEKALAHAPAEPPPLNRLGDNLVDGYMAYNTEMTHVVGGVLKGTAGLLNFVRGLNPADPYNLTHPAAYMQNVSMTLSGLVSTVAHPERVVTAVVEGFKKDPAEFLGRLIPELFGTKGTGFATGGLRVAAREGLEAAATNPVTRNGLKYGDNATGTPPTGLPDAMTPQWPPAGATDNAVSQLPPGWTIDNAPTPTHPPTGFADNATPSTPAGYGDNAAPPSTPTGAADNAAPPKDWDGLAQSTDNVGEGAVHADSVDGKTAQDFLDDQYPEIQGVNDGPGGHADNGFQYEPHVSADEFGDLGVDQKHQVAAGELNDGAVSWPDSNDAIAYGRDQWNDYASNLPEPTKKSLLDYTDDHWGDADPGYATYKEMNGYLRGNGDLGTPDVLRNIDEVDRALAGRPLPEDVMVVRGQGVSHYGVDHPGDLVGRTETDPGYMSTSLGDHPVGAFEGKPGILHLRVPEGTDALWMEKVSHYGMGERELLLGRGTSYKVTRAFEDESGQWHIYGEVLPRG